MKKYFLSVCIITLYFVGFFASDDEGNPSSESSSSKLRTEQEQVRVENNNNSSEPTIKNDVEEIASSPKVISQIRDVEELRQSINNTVWTHTTKGDVWLRFEFVGNTVKQYGALPQKGEWRYDGDSQFELSERRSGSDGKRFIVATFMPKTESLAMFELPVTFNFRDYHLYLNGQDIGGFIMADYEWD